MNKVMTTALAITTTILLAGTSFTSQAMNPYVESALVDVCKATKSNNVFRYKNTIKSYHLKEKVVALKVMCNGEDIIDFAEKYGANRTAAKLQRSIGEVSITDVAKLEKINVTF